MLILRWDFNLTGAFNFPWHLHTNNLAENWEALSRDFRLNKVGRSNGKALLNRIEQNLKPSRYPECTGSSLTTLAGVSIEVDTKLMAASPISICWNSVLRLLIVNLQIDGIQY